MLDTHLLTIYSLFFISLLFLYSFVFCVSCDCYSILSNSFVLRDDVPSIFTFIIGSILFCLILFFASSNSWLFTSKFFSFIYSILVVNTWRYSFYISVEYITLLQDYSSIQNASQICKASNYFLICRKTMREVRRQRETFCNVFTV